MKKQQVLSFGLTILSLLMAIFLEFLQIETSLNNLGKMPCDISWSAKSCKTILIAKGSESGGGTK